MSSKRTWLLLFPVLGACAFLLFFRLGEEPVFGDETAYLQVGARAWRTNQWAPLLYAADKVFPWKPPLSIWASAIGFGLFGENELGGRFFGALAGLLLCAVLAHLALREGNAWTMVLAPLALVTAPPLLLEHGLRSGVPEPWLLLAVTGSFASYLASAEWSRPKRLIAVGLWSLLNGWTKGIVGPLIVGGTLFLVELMVPISTPSQGTMKARLRGALSIATAASLPGLAIYLAWMGFSLGWTGMVDFLTFDLAQRATSGIDPIHLQPASMYLEAIAANFGAFALLAPLWLLISLWRGRNSARDDFQRDRRLQVTILLWGLVTVVLFAIPSSRLAWYVYPAYPALALATALTLDALRRWSSRFRGGLLAFLLCLAVIVGARASALAEAWPERDPVSLAALQHLLDDDPAARAFTELSLKRNAETNLHLPAWRRYYLRRFAPLAERALPANLPACAFIVTATPDLWASELEARDSRWIEVRGTRAGETPLFVFDLCDGRFAGRKQEGHD